MVIFKMNRILSLIQEQIKELNITINLENACKIYNYIGTPCYDHKLFTRIIILFTARLEGKTLLKKEIVGNSSKLPKEINHLIITQRNILKRKGIKIPSYCSSAWNKRLAELLNCKPLPKIKSSYTPSKICAEMINKYGLDKKELSEISGISLVSIKKNMEKTEILI